MLIKALKKLGRREAPSAPAITENPPTLVTWHFDEPSETATSTISRPEIAIKGWLSFAGPVDLDTLDLSVSLGTKRQRIGFCERPDVAAAHPSLVCVGFSHLLDLDATDLTQLSATDAALSFDLELDGMHHTRSLRVLANKRIKERSNYFRLHDDEHREALERGPLGEEQIRSWREEGYIVLKKFYDDERIEKINAYMDGLWANRTRLDWPVTVDEYIGTPHEARRRFSQAEDGVRDQPYKLNDLYLASDTIRATVLNADLARILSSLLYAGTPMICSSLYFERGSQQRKHFDTFFMPPLIRNRMLATWIALEDVQQDSGPLKYYPGSHMIDPYVFSDGRYNLRGAEREDCYRYIDNELERRGIEATHFLAEKGDLFVWHPHLLHGGNAIDNDRATRRSLVTHYFCKEDHPAGDATEYAPGCFYLNRDYLPPTVA